MALAISGLVRIQDMADYGDAQTWAGLHTFNAGLAVASGQVATIERINAVDGDGLALYDDGGNLGVFVKDGGRVGINEAVPGAQLHVTSSDAAVIGQIIELAATPTANAFEVNTNGGSGGDLMRIDSGGRIGVGIAPSEPLSLYIGAAGDTIKTSSADGASFTVTHSSGAGRSTQVELRRGNDSYIAAIQFENSSALIDDFGIGINDNSGTFRIGPKNLVSSYVQILGTSGYVGINTVPSAMLHIDQSSDAGAIPVLILDQADISEGFINFIGSDRGVITGVTNSVASVRVELGGTVYRLPLYADA